MTRAIVKFIDEFGHYVLAVGHQGNGGDIVPEELHKFLKKKIKEHKVNSPNNIKDISCIAMQYAIYAKVQEGCAYLVETTRTEEYVYIVEHDCNTFKLTTIEKSLEFLKVTN